MHLKKRLEPKASTNAPTRARKKQQVIVLDGPTTAPVLLEQTLSTTTTSTATIDYSMALSLMENAASFTSKELWINDIFWSETLAITVDNSDSSSGMETMNDLGVSQRSRHELVAQSVHASWRRGELLENFVVRVGRTPLPGCRSDFTTLPPEPLQKQPDVVLLWGRRLASWLLALGESGGHSGLRGSGRLSVIPYVHGRTELYCAQACLA
jgi:hypothetical protein